MASPMSPFWLTGVCLASVLVTWCELTHALGPRSSLDRAPARRHERARIRCERCAVRGHARWRAIASRFRVGPRHLLGYYGGGLGSAGDLAFDSDGTLFGTASYGAYSASYLVRINVATGQAQTVGSTGFHDVFGLAFGPDAQLYGVADGDKYSTPG